MLWRVARLRLDHIIAILSTNAIILTRILVAPTVIIDTVQQDRNTLEHHEDRRSISVAGPSTESDEKLHTGRNSYTGAGQASFHHQPSSLEWSARNLPVQQEQLISVIDRQVAHIMSCRERKL